MDDVVHDIHEDKVHSFEDAEQPRRLVQASGAIRGVIIGLARALTRPSQMKVFVFLAKKKWKQRAGAAEKESWSKLLGPPVLVEGAIGAFMYDVFAKTTGHIERSGGVPYTGAYQAYFNTFAAGTVAGCTSAVLNTPYNNLVRLHGGYATPATVWRGLQSGELALSGKRSLFSGVGHACYRDSFSVACMFTSNLWFKKNLPQPPCDSLAWGTFHAFMAGGLGGAVGTMSAIPFIRVREVSTQYAGTHFLKVARKLISAKNGIGGFGVLFAGLPPVALAAFLPNAMGMAAMHLSAELNRVVEEVPDDIADYAIPSVSKA